MRDDEIVDLFWNRNEKAIEETKLKYNQYCQSISYRILGNREDAEECFNDSLIAAWNSIPPQKPNNLKTYIGKLIRNISISRYRDSHAEKRCPNEFTVSIEEMEEVAVDADFDDSIDENRISEAISQFLRTLPETERNMMVRRYWFNDSILSISERFGFGESKVKVTLKRTRDRLSEYLKKEGFIR